MTTGVTTYSGATTSHAEKTGGIMNGMKDKASAANGSAVNGGFSNGGFVNHASANGHFTNGMLTTEAAKWSPSPLETLAQDLEKNARIVSNFLRCMGQEQPSFARDTSVNVLPSGTPQEVQIAREQVLENALQIFHMAAGPSTFIENVILGYHNMANFRWLSHFGLFDIVPLYGSISYAEAAQRANVTESRLKSIARLAMTNHLFEEPSPGQIAHSATSAAMKTNQNWNDQRIWAAEVITPTIANMVEAHEKWPTSTAKNHTPFNAAFKTDLSVYEYTAQHPEMYKLFGRVMNALAANPRSDINHLVNSFDWASLGKGTVVDIGGNIGHSCVVLAQTFPELDFICQDTAQVIVQGAEQVREKNGLSIANRIQFQEYDFFTEQPVKGADVYLIRQIFHNWDFDNCVKILSNIVPAMKPGSHIAVADFVLPEPGSVPSVTERVLRSRDVGMMQLFNSKERNMDEWTSIIEKADPRLKINAVNQPWGSSLSVIDLVLKE